MSETTEHGGGAEPAFWLIQKDEELTNIMLDRAEMERLTPMWPEWWCAVPFYTAPTPPTRGDQAEVARLREALEDIARKNQERQWMGSDASDGYGDQGWVVLDGQYAKIAKAALSPTSSAEPQAAVPVGELRAKLKDAALKYFMVGDRIMISIDAAIAALAAAPVTGDRYERAGRHLHEKAKSLGWTDDGEGAYEFVVRKHYEGGLADSVVRKTRVEEIVQRAQKDMADGHGLTWVRSEDLVRILATPPSGGGDHAAEPQAPDV